MFSIWSVRQSPILFPWHIKSLLSHSTNMATFVELRQPVTTLVTAFNNHKNLTNYENPDPVNG